MEVSDEIVETFLLDKRAEATRERKMYRYKAQYYLDCDDGIEKAAIGWAQPSPEELLMRKEAEQEYRITLARLAEAINHLSKTQARRIRARYLLGMKVIEIAAAEGVIPSCVSTSIRAGLRTFANILKRRIGGCPENGNSGTAERREEKVEKELRQLENRQKTLLNKQRDAERRARTRRLIERGAIVEGVFSLAPNLSGEEVKAFFVALFHLPGAAELAAKLPKSADEPYVPWL